MISGVDVDAEAEEVLNELNLLTAEGDDSNMSSNKIEDSDWSKSLGKSTIAIILCGLSY